MTAPSDLTGKKFGQLTAIKYVYSNHRGVRVWLFSCTCGNFIEASGTSVVSRAKKDTTGLLPACGCIRNKLLAERQYKHGYSYHTLNSILTAMKQRCYNPNNQDYMSYGAKGVRICDEWLQDSNAFYQWALNAGWYKGCHVDKDIINKEAKLYSPDTCSIVDPHTNLSFKRDTK